MFASIFGSKKKANSDEHLDTPPIPAARPDDEFVMVDQQRPGGSGSLYPSFSPGAISPPALPATRPAPQPPFHYLEGVPFKLSKELQMCSNKEAFAVQIGDVLAFTARKLQLDNVDYDFSCERSVRREYSS